eukprot:3939654-Rhodomonas_salina.2
MAHMTRCKSMIEALAAGGDFHSRTAIDIVVTRETGQVRAHPGGGGEGGGAAGAEWRQGRAPPRQGQVRQRAQVCKGRLFLAAALRVAASHPMRSLARSDRVAACKAAGVDAERGALPDRELLDCVREDEERAGRGPERDARGGARDHQQVR